jgi:hypothetical protein
MKYVEKHYGEGSGSGERFLKHPKTIIDVEEDGTAELEMVQIKGIDKTIRDTIVRLGKNAKLIVSERLLTNLEQDAVSDITVELYGEDSTARSYQGPWRRTTQNRFSTSACAATRPAAGISSVTDNNGQRKGFLHYPRSRHSIRTPSSYTRRP